MIKYVFVALRASMVLLPPLLVSCSGQSSESPKPKPSAIASLDYTKGPGNFMVCLSIDVEGDEMKSVTMPARIIFQSWGRLTGPITDGNSFDTKALGTGPEADALSSYAIVTTEPFTVSTDKRCVRVKARAAISKGFGWTHELIPEGMKFSFQAEDQHLTSEYRLIMPIDDPKPSLPDQVLASGLLNGTPVADISNPITILEPL